MVRFPCAGEVDPTRSDRVGRCLATNVGDEGGFAPNVQGAEESLDILTEAITKAGYAGKVKIGLYVLPPPSSRSNSNPTGSPAMLPPPSSTRTASTTLSECIFDARSSA